jgi:hypothetical protein
MKDIRYRFSSGRFNLLTKDTYVLFKERYPDVDCSYEQFRAIITKQNEKIKYYAMHTTEGINLPHLMGHIFCKLVDYTLIAKGAIEDKGSTKKLKYKVLHINHYTNGKLGKIVYNFCPKNYKMENYQVWTFKPFRHFKRDFSKILKNLNGNNNHFITHVAL